MHRRHPRGSVRVQDRALRAPGTAVLLVRAPGAHRLDANARRPLRAQRRGLRRAACRSVARIDVLRHDAVRVSGTGGATPGSRLARPADACLVSGDRGRECHRGCGRQHHGSPVHAQSDGPWRALDCRDPFGECRALGLRCGKCGTRDVPGVLPRSSNERELFPGTATLALGLVGAMPPMSLGTIVLVAGTAVAFDGSLGFNGLIYDDLYVTHSRFAACACLHDLPHSSARV